jgi:hypothetical protein
MNKFYLRIRELVHLDISEFTVLIVIYGYFRYNHPTFKLILRASK